MNLLPWQETLCAHGELYRVGGHVRDRLMELTESPDTDFLVRGVPPEQLERILGRYGTLSLVGKSFGVYKFRDANTDTTYDVVYPRRERSTGSGHRDFDVDWDWRMPVAEDLGRRDFTINAVAQNVVDDAIIDPHGGRDDIEARVLRMIFPGAFAEDPLRILRGVRFAGRFRMNIEADTRAAMGQSSRLLSTLSAERVGEELTKLLAQVERPGACFTLFRDIGALRIVLPELDRCAGVEQNEYHADDVFVHSLKTCDCAPAANALVRWAALMHDVGKVDAKQVLAGDDGEERVVFYGHEKISADLTRVTLTRLRYGHEFVARCTHLVAEHMFNYQSDWNDATVRRFMRRVGEQNLEDLFLLRAADCGSRELVEEIGKLRELESRIQAEREAAHAIRITDLAVGGAEVMEILGIKEGARVGEVLADLLERVIEEPALNNKETLTGIVRGEHGKRAQKNRKPK